MRRVENPALKRRILTHLASLYKIGETREPNHLSTYVYCRTRAFLDQKQTTVEPTDDEIMLFAIGYGLQDVLTPKSAKTPVYENEGIIYRPDMSFQLAPAEVEQLVELKTTRKSAKYHFMDEQIPETWLEYMMGGCHLRGTTQYDLIVLYMMGNYAPPFPQMYSDTFFFNEPEGCEEEIERNWLELLERKRILDNALATGQIPTPFQHCRTWECKYCMYKLVCTTIAQARGLPIPEEKK